MNISLSAKWLPLRPGMLELRIRIGAEKPAPNLRARKIVGKAPAT